MECILGKTQTYFSDGDTLIGHIQPGLLSNFDNMKHNIDTIITSLKDLMQNGSIQASVENLHSTTSKLDSIMYSVKIESIINDIQDLIAVLSSNKTEIDGIIKD